MKLKFKMEDYAAVADMDTHDNDSTCSDLDKLLKEFDYWEKGTVELHRENRSLTLNLKSLQKRCDIYMQSEKCLTEDNFQLNQIIKNLQDILHKRCNLENENTELKEQLEMLHKETEQLEQQHRQQMRNALDELQAIKEAHKNEIKSVQNSTTLQLRKEIESLDKTIQDKSSDIRQLQKQLSDVERDKHTEIIKLRLEYDAKLLKLQKQNTKTQAQSSSVNSDIYRRKLQAAKIESEKEITSLRKRVDELEKQLSNASKRRKA